MKKQLIVIIAIFSLVAFSVPAIAGEESPWKSEDKYSEKVLAKLDFGIKNFLGGWTEIIRRPLIYKENDQNVIKGLGEGIWNAVLFTAGGAVHTATFLCPKTDLPLKNGGVQI